MGLAEAPSFAAVVVEGRLRLSVKPVVADLRERLAYFYEAPKAALNRVLKHSQVAALVLREMELCARTRRLDFLGGRGSGDLATHAATPANICTGASKPASGSTPMSEAPSNAAAALPMNRADV